MKKHNQSLGAASLALASPISILVTPHARVKQDQTVPPRSYLHTLLPIWCTSIDLCRTEFPVTKSRIRSGSTSSKRTSPTCATSPTLGALGYLRLYEAVRELIAVDWKVSGVAACQL